jgi:hypothetical protein
MSMPPATSSLRERRLREWVGYKTFCGMVLGSKYRLKGLIEPPRDNHEIYIAESLLKPLSAYEAHLFDLDEGVRNLRQSRVRSLRRMQARPSVVDVFRYGKMILVVSRLEGQSGREARADRRQEMGTLAR